MIRMVRTLVRNSTVKKPASEKLYEPPLPSSAPPRDDQGKAPLKLSLAWNTCTVEHWEKRLAQIPRSNLIQTWPYAQTMRAIEHKMTRFGLIMDGERELGLLQIQEIKFFRLFHVVILDRGPLWFDAPVPRAMWDSFFEAFTQAFPRSIGRWRRIMPEVLMDEPLKQTLGRLDFRYKSRGYQSIWVDLKPDANTIRQNLKRNWRNHLNSAERTPMRVENDNKADHLSWLLKNYEADRRARRYPGPSVDIVKSLVICSRPKNQVLMLRATLGGEPVASILVLLHGKSATYQIGYTSEEGRKVSAHHLLLWRAMMELKERGIEDLDLGGINPDSARGVTTFKEGLGGKTFELIGLYT